MSMSKTTLSNYSTHIREIPAGLIIILVQSCELAGVPREECHTSLLAWQLPGGAVWKGYPVWAARAVLVEQLRGP